MTRKPLVPLIPHLRMDLGNDAPVAAAPMQTCKSSAHCRWCTTVKCMEWEPPRQFRCAEGKGEGKGLRWTPHQMVHEVLSGGNKM